VVPNSYIGRPSGSRSTKLFAATTHPYRQYGRQSLVYPTKFLPERKTPPNSRIHDKFHPEQKAQPSPKQKEVPKAPNAVSLSKEPRTPCSRLCFQVSRDSPGRHDETYRKSSSFKLTIPAISILKENPAKSQKTQTSKHTHTHTRGQQRKGSWTERSAFRSQPWCSRRIENKFPDCSRVKWGNGVLTRWSTASEHAGRKTVSSARLRRFCGGESGEWDGVNLRHIVFGAEDYSAL
jgi:hypothetical protein